MTQLGLEASGEVGLAGEGAERLRSPPPEKLPSVDRPERDPFDQAMVDAEVE